MDRVNETPSIVDIKRFPQREDEKKKAKKKYPQSAESFHEHLKKAFERMDNEEDNIIDITNYQNKPIRTNTPDLTGVQKRENEREAKRLYED